MTDYTSTPVNIGYCATNFFMKKPTTKQPETAVIAPKKKKPISFRPSKELRELFDDAERLGLKQSDLINEALRLSGEGIIARAAEERLNDARRIKTKSKGHVTGNG